MNAPLDRDKQIDLMVNAAHRIEERAAAWMRDPAIRSSLSRPSPNQPQKSGSHSVTQLRYGGCR